MRVEVLGPVRVLDDGGGEVPLSPQLRRLTGILVAADGRSVSADRLAEHLTGGPSEGSTLRTAVSRLRKIVGDRLASADGGYRLVLETDELDRAVFERLLGAADGCDGGERVDLLASAVELWRGPAFGDLADEAWASAAAAGLDESRASSIEALAACLVEGGRFREAVEILEGHVVEHPLRERPVGLLMRALAGGGRLAEALRAFHRFRAVLRAEAGLEPSAELRRIEGELLADEPAPDVSGAPSLPTGTVTFLFTDIEGSTERWADDEAAMAAALASHDEVLCEVVQAHGGVVFKHTGDGVCAAFASAASAAASAAVAQGRLELPVRMGVHTGEAELRGGDYFGPTLNRVARIMDAGHGGQILMSAATAALVRDTEQTDLGEHRLKGLSGVERIVQLGVDRFSPLRVATAAKGNLPNEMSSFVGRADDVATLTERVLDHRLVTLIGVGGTGKTRLAIESGRAVAPTFPDGCWIAELAMVSSADAVPYVVAAGLGLPTPESGDVVDYVIGRVRHDRRLLIVDNCEHVLDAAGELIERLLTSCPTLTVLATSREPLLLGGEQLVAVPALSLDDAQELMLDRARGEAPGLPVDDVQLAAVAELCERLDRLPLAIELASARLRSMTPVEVLERIDDRFRLLAGGRRSRTERHQTIRNAVEWSYDMCSETEQVVFDRLSIFASRFDVSAARAVASTPHIDGVDVDEALAHLVDRSLVQRVLAEDGTSQFQLLETMRAYGRERLAHTGRIEQARDARAAHVSREARALNLRSMGPDEVDVHRRLRALRADSLVAVDWYVDHRRWGSAADVAHSHHFSAPGDAVAMMRRIADLALRTPDDLEPVDRAVFEVFAENPDRGPDAREQEQRAQRDVLAWLEGEAALDRTFVGAGPVAAIAWHVDAVVLHQFDTYIDRLRDAPVGVRFTAAHDLFFAMIFASWSDESDDRRADRWQSDDVERMGLVERLAEDLEAMADELNSATARRRCAAVLGLLEEARGNYAEAADLEERSLDGVEVPTHYDVLAGTRVVRLKALSGRDVTGDDLRRPFEWSIGEMQFLALSSALCSAAIALDVLGRSDLARRLLLHVLPLSERGHQARLFADRLSPDLLAVLRSDVLPDESIDDAVAAVYAIADELDAADEARVCSAAADQR